MYIHKYKSTLIIKTIYSMWTEKKTKNKTK